jgi:hypothetical protein
MVNRASLLILCLVLATTPITIVAVAAPTVGINAGEWIKWNITVIAPAQNETVILTMTAWLEVTVQSVTGTQVSGTYVGSSGNQLGLPVSSTDFTVDVSTGAGTAIYGNVPLIVPANLSVGDSVPGTSLMVTLNTTQDDRDAAYAVGLTNATSSANATSQFYWDRVKGVLLKATVNYSDRSMALLEVVDTNMWGASVKAGDWIRWDITVTYGGQSTTMWLQVTIENVSITRVVAAYESNLPGMPNEPTDFSVNVATGAQNTSIYSAIDRLMIVSANLNSGDPLMGTRLRANGTATKDGRDAALVALLTLNGGNSTYYWDRVKGVLLEYSSSLGNTTTLIQVADTNMWGLGINWSLWITVAIVVVLVVLVVAYVAMRRKRSAEA